MFGFLCTTEKYLNRFQHFKLISIKRGAYLDNDSLGWISKNKKAMSPLIATVLLIAFAVALGAMIMNWAPTIGETGPDCSGIIMILNPYLCYAENMIKISVKNTGDRIEAVTLKAIDDTGETTKRLPDSRVKKGSVLKKDIPFIKTGRLDIFLIPSIMHNEEVVDCEEPALEIKNVPGCTE